MYLCTLLASLLQMQFGKTPLVIFNICFTLDAFCQRDHYEASPTFSFQRAPQVRASDSTVSGTKNLQNKKLAMSYVICQPT